MNDLYKAVLCKPADDTVRLAYADWLEENDQPARAKFIRVQCELARFPKSRCRWCSDTKRCASLDCQYPGNSLEYDALRARERELLRNTPIWWTGPGFDLIEWSRGFISSRPRSARGAKTDGFTASIRWTRRSSVTARKAASPPRAAGCSATGTGDVDD